MSRRDTAIVNRLRAGRFDFEADVPVHFCWGVMTGAFAVLLGAMVTRCLMGWQ